MSTSDTSPDDEDSDDMPTDNLEGDFSDTEDNDHLASYSRRRPIQHHSLNRVAKSSTMESRASPPSRNQQPQQPQQPPLSHKQQQLHQSTPSQRISSPLTAPVTDLATNDVEADKMKKLLEWELSALEADDLRSHAWYHGQQVDRTEAERLLRQCVAEEHGFATTTIITATNNNTDMITPPNSSTATIGSSSLQQHVEEDTSDLDRTEDVSSDSSDADDFLNDLVDERGVVPDPSVTTSSTMAEALLLQQRHHTDGVLQTKRPKRPHRPRRHFYCFLVRDSMNVRPPGRYVVSCLRVDKYEDLEMGDKYKARHCHNDEQRRKFRRQQQRRQRRQNRHPVLHFVVNEIILQPGTVYERSQFSFGESLPSMATTNSTAVVNNNVGLNEQRQCQPGFDSVPDLIRYYVGGADDNAVLSYGGGNDGAVSGSMTLSREAQTEVRIRYPCNRRRPLMIDNSLVEAATPNTLPSMTDNSRLVRPRCRTLTTASTRTEGLRVLSTSPNGTTESSTSSQNTNHRHHSPSQPPQTSKWMRVQSSSRSSIRRTPSSTITSAMATSMMPSSAAGSANETQSQSSTLSHSPRIEPRFSITESTSVSPGPSVNTLPRLSRSAQELLKNVPSRFRSSEMASTSMDSSIKTLPRQPKSSYLLPSTSGSSSSSSERPSTSESKSKSDQPSISLQHTPSYSGMPSRNTPHLTISDLLSSPSPSFMDSSRLSRGISRTNSLNRELIETPSSNFSINTMLGTNDGELSPTVNIDAPGTSSSIGNMFNERTVDSHSLPYHSDAMSSFVRVRVRNGYRSMLNRMRRPQMLRPERLIQLANISGLGGFFGSSNRFQNRSASHRFMSERRQGPSHSQNIERSLDNENNGEEQEQQRPSSSDLSCISTSTLTNEQIERNRDSNGKLTDRQKEEQAAKQPQPNERNFKQEVNVQGGTQDAEVQEVENPIQNTEVRNRSVEERTLNDRNDTNVNGQQTDELNASNPDSNAENSSLEASENENFQKCRVRCNNTMRQGLVDMSEQSRPDHQNHQLTQMTGTLNSDPQQQRSRQRHYDLDHLRERTETELHRIIPGTENRRPARLNNRTSRPAISGIGPSAQIRDTRNSIMLSNNYLAENMVRRWTGLERLTYQNREYEVAVIHDGQQIPLNELLPRTRRQRRQNNRLVTASGNHQVPAGDDLPSAGEFVKEHVTPSGETQLPVSKNMYHPQVDQGITCHSNVNQKGFFTPVTKARFSNSALTFSDFYDPVTTTDLSREVGACFVGVDSMGSEMACDYVNINPHIDDHNNAFDENNTQDLEINHFDRIHYQKKHQSNNNYNSFDDNIEKGVDYENIISNNTEDSNNFNYENISQNTDEKRQQLINDCNEGSTAVAAALRAVHLAIIGDPDDSGGATVGTGKLAAALCRADGRVTVLPYRRNFIECDQVKPLLNTCPLQLLGQPGSAGRRARLDVIERFACLQYLVAMTVIVTPCLLLIGSNINNKENLADTNLEWSLEDEYEYRRRRFYYRCAGISSLCVSDNNSTSDDDDDESYKLTANSDFDSGYSLPPREEWAVEKRHWLDLLTRHRAAALDKWIRTAADAKQAVGDVYGYRALMSALCSDRIQALQDAWATLRRLHTATAVAFESRLRPEFLGRREKNLVAVLGKPGINDIDDNDLNELLQLPPNATVPDATALAVLYEHLYNDNNSDTGSSTTAASSNDIGSKKKKDPRLSSFFTSPLLLSPSPWSSLNSGISGGLGSSVASDYGLSALHVQCIQYSEWVQQSYGNDDSILPSTKPPMLQLDRFRSNFRALLRQYSGGDFDDYNDDDESFNYILGCKDENTSDYEEFNCKKNEDFAYERQYEDNVEEYGSSGGDYDDCGDDDDDDATVICSSNRSSLSAVRSVEVDTMCKDSHVEATAEKLRQTTTKNEKFHRHKQDQEEDRYYRWIEDASAYGPGPAPLNIVFCTELHVRLFWPPTLFLQDINDDKDTIDPKLAIPAYALGTTYMATATAVYDSEDGSTNHAIPSLALNHVITTQLDQAAQDMRLRYKAMDDFLDKACAYSTLIAKITHEDNTMMGKQQQHSSLSQCV